MTRQRISFLVLVLILITSCTSQTPTSGALPAAATEIAPTFTPTPSPVMGSLSTVSLVSPSPEQPACQDYTYLPASTQVEIIGTFRDYAQVKYSLAGVAGIGWIAKANLVELPAGVPELTVDQAGWTDVLNFKTWRFYSPENGGTLDIDLPPDLGSDDASDWNHHPVTPPLRMRFGIVNEGSAWSLVKLEGVDQDPNRKEWWEGMHRMNISFMNNNFDFCVQDGSSGTCNAYFTVHIDGEKIITLQFNDVNGKSFQVFDESGNMVQEIDLTTLPGVNLPDGLFPSGWFMFGTSIGPPGKINVTNLSVTTRPSGKYVESWLTQPGLAELAKPLGISIGNNLNPNDLHGIPLCTVAKHDYNLSFLVRFSMTSYWLAPGEYDFEGLDQQVNDTIKNGYTIYASHLLEGEPSTLPDWLKNGNFTKDELFEILKGHIQTLVSRYENQITYWSIGNEAPTRDSIPGLDFWFDHLGPEYLEKAFLWAREAGGPDEILILNADNNESPRDTWTTHNVNAQYEMVKNLKDKNLPIDAIGMEMHYFLPWNSQIPPKKEDVVATMKKFGELGVKVLITEMEVNLHEVNIPQAEKEAFETQLYADMMSACIEAGNCIAFTTWGIADPSPQTPYWDYPETPMDAAPYLFDVNYQPKPPYFAVRDVLLAAQK